MIFIKERWRKSLLVTMTAHIVAAAALGIFVYAHPLKKIEPEILEVSLTLGAASTVAKAATVQKNPLVDRDAITEKNREPVPQKMATSAPAQTNTLTNNNSTAATSAGSHGQTSETTGTGSGLASQNSVPPPGTNVPVTRPYKVSGNSPVYPPQARVRGVQGTVLVRALIGTEGEIIQASVSGSSGDGELDNAAVQSVYTWSFSPARDRYGARCRCYVTIPVSFKLT